MIQNILNIQRIVDKEKKIFKCIMFLTFLISMVFIVRIFIVKGIDRYYLESTLFFIRTFNFILSLLASGSCLISFNRLKNDSVFIIYLMYLGLSIGILFGQIDYLTFLYNEFSLSNYIIVSTSLLRVMLLLIAISPKNKIKTFIVSNKKLSIIFVVVYTIIFGLIENRINLYISSNIFFFIGYNLFLSLVYILVAIRLLLTGIREKEYLFIVLSTSIFMLAIKAIYAIIFSNQVSFYVKLTSVSITYAISLIVIGGTFIELYIYINREKLLNKNLKIFYNIVDDNKHSFMMIYNEEFEIIYTNKKIKEYYSNLEYEDIDRIKSIFSEIYNKIKNDEDVLDVLNKGEAWRGIIKNDLGNTTMDCAIQYIDTAYDNREIAVTCMDISEGISKELEIEKLKVYTKERTEFMSNISHELRTPVNIFYSTLQLLDKFSEKEDVDFNQLYEKYNKTLHINCKRMLRLINNVVDISKIESGILKGKFDYYNLVAIVEDVSLSVVNYAQLKSIDIVFDTNNEESIIRCDPTLIERVMLNLLSNAIKFSPEKSSIYVTVNVSDDFTEIIVKDEGIGIAKSDRKAIFERFMQADKSLTRANEGSGIGLSIVKSILDLHEGYINVESEIGKGSEFKILLPNKFNSFEKYKIYDINTYNTELELSDIYEILINKEN